MVRSSDVEECSGGAGGASVGCWTIGSASARLNFSGNAGVVSSVEVVASIASGTNEGVGRDSRAGCVVSCAVGNSLEWHAY